MMPSGRKKIAFIISDIDKALAFEWLASQLRPHYELVFILISKQNTALEIFIKSLGMNHYVMDDAQYPGHLKKIVRLFAILRLEKPHMVHAHLWRATLLSMMVAWILRVPKRIFTRHHGTIHYDLYPYGRKWDVLNNSLATHIVAISKTTQDILVNRDKASPQKIHLIYHGFLLESFSNVEENRVSHLKSKYCLDNGTHPVIGVISRYTYWKGIQYIVPAFVNLKRKFPKAVLLLAGAEGEYRESIQQELNKLKPTDYREITFEQDVPALYRLMDVYVHAPIDPHVEAFGQTYVEALASGIPSVFTLSGVAREFIEHEKNALVVDFKNSDAIEKSIERILSNEFLRKHLVLNGNVSAQQFSLDNMITKLKTLYG